ncbi:hypothetical protein HNR46_003007 [Haloferula luteola]|uniref:TPM domain-containing protein n=1 Tax=Haloferula luteola TaxID=595692 RepID=A0A840VG13_9BACT|nr:TPM domain-containing protein [Haloferula luteola]MBB5352759.1 hypothetical protein [Haloferula luteola]
MKRWLKGLLLRLLPWVWILPLAAQVGRVNSVPPAPAGGVLDDARLFTTSPGRLRAMEERIQRVSASSGMPIYVVFFDSLIGRRMGDEVQLLRDAWLGDGTGVLLAIETGNGQYWLNWADGQPVQVEGQAAVPVVHKGAMPPQEQLLIDQQIEDLGRMPTGSMDHAERMVEVLLKGIERSMGPGSKGSSASTGAILVITLAGMAMLLLAGLLLVKRARSVERRTKEKFRFPQVKVRRRLGGRYSGGRVREMSFGASSSE